MATRENEITIQTQPRPDRRGMGLVGTPVELTRVQAKGKGFDVSTIQHPTQGWFETVLFSLDPQGEPTGPLITTTRPEARQVHQFITSVTAKALQVRR